MPKKSYERYQFDIMNARKRHSYQIERHKWSSEKLKCEI